VPGAPAPPTGLRVGLADDSVLVREALAGITAASDELDLAAVCVEADDMLAAVADQRLDVVVTEIGLQPGMTDEGIRLAATLRESHPSVGVVVFSEYCEPRSATDLLQAGSNGRAYLLKGRLDSANQLVAAIVEVARGGSVIDPKVVEALVHGDDAAGVRPSLAALSPRERKILAEMARGASNQGIAETLELTKRAVEKGINAIFAKLGLAPTPDVSRRVRAVLLYLTSSGVEPARQESSRPMARPRATAPEREDASSLR
jgi:DNA-binding NarL/FixJ family response regulator